MASITEGEALWSSVHACERMHACRCVQCTCGVYTVHEGLTDPCTDSQVLGYAIIVGACVTKVPQIRVITSGRSAAGLSALSFELEAVGLLVHMG